MRKNAAVLLVFSVGMAICAFLIGWGMRSVQPVEPRIIVRGCPDGGQAPPRGELPDVPPPPAPSVPPAPAPPAPPGTLLAPGDWPVGIWISAAGGDAIPRGPTGGKVVEGGARFEFVKGRPGSKTPWNVVFWLPAPGHTDAKTISGACGYYPSGTAFCKGYGLSGDHSSRGGIAFARVGDHVRVSIVIGQQALVTTEIVPR